MVWRHTRLRACRTGHFLSPLEGEMSAQQTEGGITAAADRALKIIAPPLTPLCPLPGASPPQGGERKSA